MLAELPLHSSLAVADERTRHGRQAVAAAIALGVLTDATLRSGVHGVGVTIWTMALVATLVLLARRGERPLTVGAAVLATLAVAFGGAFAWRDADGLAALNAGALAAALCALGASVARGAELPLERATVLDYLRGVRGAARELATGAPSLARDVARVGELRAGGRAPAVLGTALRGALLAAPALAVFGLLFVSADPAFARLLARLVDVDGGRLATHLVVTTFGAWGAAGYLHGAIFAAPAPEDDAPTGRPRRWLARVRGAVRGADVCVALALLDALFAAFVVVQLGWLFGGARVVATTDVSYAEYARRGFFELVTASALALPLLVGAHALAEPERASPPVRRTFLVAAGALLVLLGVVMLSAADRMRLYQAAYGLTELRYYASAGMAWLAAVFAWSAATLLRGRTAPFALGTLALAWAWVLGLNAVDPAARVAAANTTRAEAGARFDAAHAAALGADAVPVLVGRTLPALERQRRGAEYCTIAAALVRRFGPDAPAEWRTSTVAGARARRLVAARVPALRGCPR
jgi:hypothetical protein